MKLTSLKAEHYFLYLWKWPLSWWISLHHWKRNCICVASDNKNITFRYLGWDLGANFDSLNHDSLLDSLNNVIYMQILKSIMAIIGFCVYCSILHIPCYILDPRSTKILDWKSFIWWFSWQCSGTWEGHCRSSSRERTELLLIRLFP